MLLCATHRAAYIDNRQAWDGVLDPTGQVVLQLRPAGPRQRLRR